MRNDGMITPSSIDPSVIPMTTSTDPAGDAAVSTTIIDNYSGVIITLTGAGNAQTLQDPTTTTAGKYFVVVADDGNGAHTIEVNGITMAAGEAQRFIWDGSAWGAVTAVDADDIAFTPAGDIVATNVQAAIEEVDAEKLAIANNLSDVADAATSFANVKQAATETATGVLEKATTGEATTGTDTDRAVTPAGVAAKLGAQTDHGVLVGSGSINAVTALTVGTNGQVIVGSTGVDPVFATISDGEGITTTLGAGTLGIAAEDATETNKGILEIATDVEFAVQSETDKALVPSNMAVEHPVVGTTGIFSGIVSLANDVWTRAKNYAGTDFINMFKVNDDDEIEVGATLIVGTSEAVEDSGAITIFDMPVSSTPTAGDEMSATLKIDGDNILTIGAEADGSGGIQNKFLSSPVTETKCIKIDTNLYGNPSTNPPAPETLGSVQVATFTVGTDKGRYKCPIPDDYAGGTMELRLYWTKSTAADESTKTVKWQVKEKPLYVGNNIAAGETTVSIQDVYDSAAVGEYLLYETDPMTIPATTVGRAHSFEVEAIAPTGTALSEPALVYGCLEYTAYVL